MELKSGMYKYLSGHSIKLQILLQDNHKANLTGHKQVLSIRYIRKYFKVYEH
jgi:hypothetical protein